MQNAFLRVGLTGGIAAGKSAVAALLNNQGIKVVNLDVVGRTLVEQRPELGVEVSKICGIPTLPGGKLDRQTLREHLFRHPDDRVRVEKVLHPPIWKEFERQAEETRVEGKKIIVCEAALILEAGLANQFSELIVVLAPAPARLLRAQSRDGMNAELAALMLASQADEKQLRQAATFIVDNSGGPEKLSTQVEAIVNSWRRRGFL